MPRGKRKTKVPEEKPTEVKDEAPKKAEPLTKEQVLKQAKALGLFKRNKYNATYEIIVPIKEYGGL